MYSLLIFVGITIYIIFKILSEKKIYSGFKKEIVITGIGLYLLWQQIDPTNFKIIQFIMITVIVNLVIGYIRGMTYRVYKLNSGDIVKKGTILTLTIFALGIITTHFISTIINIDISGFRSNLQIFSIGITTLGSKFSFSKRIEGMR